MQSIYFRNDIVASSEANVIKRSAAFLMEKKMARKKCISEKNLPVG